MSLPGFVAEASFFKSEGRYRLSSDWASGLRGPAVIPQQLAKELLGAKVSDVRYKGSSFELRPPCGGLGQACCRPPITSYLPPDLGPIVSCQSGLGCDVTADRCVSPCGGPGQPCCDGPERRATKWDADGRLYSPEPVGLQDMCQGGVCDRQSHRCIACGTQDGAPCCPPDAYQATARCADPSVYCEYDPASFDKSGTCRACGKQGRLPCDGPRGCDPGLGLRNGLCDICGSDFQPPCDDGCHAGLELAHGLCRQCGSAGQIPCDRGCNRGFGLRNGLCANCGGQGQIPCDSGCNPQTVLINGVCTLCGYDGQPPCANGCVYPKKVARGVCRVCGARGQIPCDSGCDQGLVLSNGYCVTPQPLPPPESCSQSGESCVPDSQPGQHCCQHPGAPQLCVYGFCKPCIPHGQEVPPGPNQLCCDWGDQVVLDQSSGKAVCGIPG
jgi:hypothetical protein